MKIAIAATSSAPDAEVSMHGARAEVYQLYDTETDMLENHPNPFAHASRGAGPQAAAYLVGMGVERVIAGRFGDKFLAELEAGGIRCIEKTGNVADVLMGLR
jgi:predicted Fe-Mo cluster-binding NifX family protein